MYSTELYKNVLIEPVHAGANRLYIVSGFASAAMAFHHMEDIRKINNSVQMQLIVGMTPRSGISNMNHSGFQKLIREDFLDIVDCRYVVSSPPVHAKIYSWYQDETPFKGFIGSANYTQVAFGNDQRELMLDCDPENARSFFETIIDDTISCLDELAGKLIPVHQQKSRIRREKIKGGKSDLSADEIELAELESVSISFLDRDGNLPQRSGLNWGQRPEEGRAPDQAYIRLPSTIYNTEFFPKRRQHFVIYTDDSEVIICTRAQDNGKAIHTPHNNSIIGEYIRRRINVPFGNPIQLDDLLRYGRTAADVYKIDEETFYLDFSVGDDE